MDIVPAANGSLTEAALTSCLREMPTYVVLRNEEDLLGNLHRGGDIDLLVDDLDLAERTVIRHFGVPVRMIRSSYARGYSWDWGHLDLVQTIEWRGACYLETKAILDQRRLSTRGRPTPAVAHEALISWFTSLLWGGFFKERYAPAIRRAVESDGAAFRHALLDAAGNKWGLRLWQAAADGRPEISARWVRSLRRAVWLRAWLRSPARTIQRCFAFVVAELRLRFQPPVPWIAILGSDGSGKSTVLNAIVHRFSACPYANVKPFHWRPRLIARGRGGTPVTEPHAKPAHGVVGSILSLLILLTDWLAGYWTRLVHIRSKGFVPAFDRVYFDLLVDPKRYRYGASPRLARALWWLLPKPDLVFLLDLAPDALLRRKQEVPPSELARQRHAYTTLVRQLPSGHVLDGSLPVDVLVDDVQRTIRAWMLERVTARLGSLAAAANNPLAVGDSSGGAPPFVGRSDAAR